MPWHGEGPGVMKHFYGELRKRGVIHVPKKISVKRGDAISVVFEPPTGAVAETLQITVSGVVLRGSGAQEAGGTRIDMSGAPRVFLQAGGRGTWSKGTSVLVTDKYVPSGATSLRVADASGFAVGESILVIRPVTTAWVAFMGMDKLVRNGVPQTWLNTSARIQADRTIAKIAGDRLTFDAPLSDSYDATYVAPGATVVKYTFPERVAHVGVEHLRVVAPTMPPTPITQPLYSLFRIDAVVDGWVNDVTSLETENSVILDTGVKRFTVRDLTISRSVVADGSSGYPLEVQLVGTQILVEGGGISGDNLFTYATMSRVSGPNVVRNVVAHGNHARLEPHERWATGLLVENVVHDDQLNLVNRGTDGTGHGWAVGWGVLWNSTAATLDVQAPPGAMNWAIGSTGAATGSGTFDSPGVQVAPKSLYRAQLCERLGVAALANAK